MIKIKILGSEWILKYQTVDQNKFLKKCDGYTDYSERKITLRKYRKNEYEIKKINTLYKSTIRHEIMHAFMYESGLWHNSNDVETWACNEEMIDWFAIQSPKIYEIYKKLDVI